MKKQTTLSSVYHGPTRMLQYVCSAQLPDAELLAINVG